MEGVFLRFKWSYSTRPDGTPSTSMETLFKIAAVGWASCNTVRSGPLQDPTPAAQSNGCACCCILFLALDRATRCARMRHP